MYKTRRKAKALWNHGLRDGHTKQPISYVLYKKHFVLAKNTMVAMVDTKGIILEWSRFFHAAVCQTYIESISQSP